MINLILVWAAVAAVFCLGYAMGYEDGSIEEAIKRDREEIERARETIKMDRKSIEKSRELDGISENSERGD